MLRSVAPWAVLLCACSGRVAADPVADGGQSGEGGGRGGRPSASKDAGSGGDSGVDGGGETDSRPPFEAAPPGEPGVVVAEPDDEAVYVFDQTKVRDYNFIVAPADLATIDLDPAAELYVPASVEFEGKTYGNAALRYKGSVGAFLTPCTSAIIPGINGGAKVGKCSMKVAFDEYDPAGRFFGMKKLNFHSMNGDPSALRDRLGYSLFREAGIAAPRAMHARVFVNGELEGLFVAVEQIDGRFTRSRFTEGGEGNLYKEIWPMHDDPQAYVAALESNRDQNPTADRMLALKDAARSGSAAVEAMTDRDYTLRYIAADRVMLNDDGAFHWWCAPGGQGNNPGGTGNHNYYWYEASVANRVWIIPWDMDNSLGGTSFVHINPEWRAQAACVCDAALASQRPASCDPLTAVWASWREDYERAVDDFLSGPFEAAKVDGAISLMSLQIEGVVTEAVGVNRAPTVDQWRAGVQGLRDAIAAMRQSRGFPY